MNSHDRVLRLAMGILLAWAAGGLPPGAQATDQCVGCHTDAARLQALVRPPAEVAEEEGEG